MHHGEAMKAIERLAGQVLGIDKFVVAHTYLGSIEGIDSRTLAVA